MFYVRTILKVGFCIYIIVYYVGQGTPFIHYPQELLLLVLCVRVHAYVCVCRYYICTFGYNLCLV